MSICLSVCLPACLSVWVSGSVSVCLALFVCPSVGRSLFVWAVCPVTLPGLSVRSSVPSNSYFGKTVETCSVFAGCKRPLRTFFVPLLISEKASVSKAANSEYVYSAASAKMPHLLTLQRLKQGLRDLGSCGLFNQVEWALYLLHTADDWSCFVVESFYERLDRIHVTKIIKECPKHSEMPPPCDKGPEEGGDVFSFDSPLLKPGISASTVELLGSLFKSQKENEVPDGNLSDEDLAGQMHEQDFYEEESDLEPDGGPEQPGDRVSNQRRHGMKDQEEDAQSQASVRSGGSHKPHQAATDTSVLREVLGDRWGFHPF